MAKTRISNGAGFRTTDGFAGGNRPLVRVTFGRGGSHLTPAERLDTGAGPLRRQGQPVCEGIVEDSDKWIDREDD